MRNQRHAFHPTRDLNARYARSKRGTLTHVPAPTLPTNTTTTTSDKPPTRPTVITNLPPGLILTPAQLTSLYDQLFDAGAFDPSDLTRKHSEWRDHDGRHVETFEGPCWTVDVLLDPEPDHHLLPASTHCPVASSNSTTDSPPSSAPTKQAPFTTLSLWCIATSDLNIDLAHHNSRASTSTWTSWLRNLLPFLPTFLSLTPPPSLSKSPSSSPLQQPPPLTITYLFNSPGISRLPTHRQAPRRRLPPPPQPQPPPWLPAAAAGSSDDTGARMLRCVRGGGGGGGCTVGGAPRPLRSAVRSGRRRAV